MAGSADDPTSDTAHRPWPLPERPWVMTQRWSNLLFMHWPVDAATMRALVPRQLALDLFDDTAWLSIAPFYLDNMHPRGIPALPWVSEFAELNVRTYVTVGGKGGVYFFSLDASKMLPVLGARTFYHLPYVLADIDIRYGADDRCEYRSRRTHPGAPEALLHVEYAPTGPVSAAAPGTLDHWLTERYCLYTTDGAGRAIRAEIHHRQWPLQPARATVHTNSMARAAGIVLPPIEPRVSFAKSIDVVVWLPMVAS